MGNNQIRWNRSVLRLALFLVFAFALTCHVFATGTATNSEGSCCMAWIYGVMAVLSLSVVLGYCWLAKKKELWFLLLFISVFVVNLGYFALSISKSLEEAMLANRIAYLGSVFLPLCMLIIIMNTCDLRIRPWVLGTLITVSVLVFLLAASGGYLQLYYKEVSVEYVGGVATLKKVYGPLHIVYFIYLFAYFGSMVGVIAHSVLREKAVPFKYATVLATLVLWNIAVWFVEQLIDWNFEFLSVSYVITELLLLLLYSLVQEYGVLQQEAPADDLSLSHPELAQLTAREMEVLQLMLENKKRKEIADALIVTENTVKKHTAHIYDKLQVSSRSELLIKLNGN